MERSALESISEAVLAIAAEREVDPVLRRLVHSARELAGARYAALGIPDGAGAFAQFVTAGMSDDLIAAMGPLPRTHGLLGAMLESPRSFRTADIRQDPRFRGWWPRAHPQMRSFLGVPIVARGEVIAAFYLTDKEAGFGDDDQRLIELLAPHAAIAIENARLAERSRELELRIAAPARAAPEAEAEVLRIAQEALHNALCHAGPGRIELRLQARDGRLAVTVADTGAGFDPQA